MSWRGSVLRLVGGLEAGFGLGNGYGWLRRRLGGGPEILILLYHHVCPPGEPWQQGGVTPEQFSRQLDYLRQHYALLPLDQVLDAVYAGRPLPSRVACITFDDGYLDNYTYALPLLQKCGAPATLFLSTAYLESDGVWPCHRLRYALWQTQATKLSSETFGEYRLDSVADRLRAMLDVELKLERLPQAVREQGTTDAVRELAVNVTGVIPRQTIEWDEAREMQASGISFGAHGHYHIALTDLPDEEVENEIRPPRQLIESQLGGKCRLFTYPDGACNEAIASRVAAVGYDYALTTQPRPPDRNSSQYLVGRVHAGQDYHAFRALASPWLLDVRRLLRR